MAPAAAFTMACVLFANMNGINRDGTSQANMVAAVAAASERIAEDVTTQGLVPQASPLLFAPRYLPGIHYLWTLDGLVIVNDVSKHDTMQRLLVCIE
ncbi:hypothetical protein F4774DRAFT_423026 [Daldinia eschscholtzii]|nr:hypothetical protein F4774DRAFT_423026 [Daldinia eschscholtzii]